MRIEQKLVFIADDGQEFTDENACEAYEAEQKRLADTTSYWSVIHNPDLTEGRGHYAVTKVKCVGPQKHEVRMFMEDWCYRTMGRPVAFVQGAAPVANWRLTESKKEHHSHDSWGHSPGVRVFLKDLVLAGGEVGLVEKE